MSKPSLGRIVHYVARQYSQELSHHPAIITRVERDGATSVSLAVFYENNIGHHVRVPQDETAKEIGTWHWPELVNE